MVRTAGTLVVVALLVAPAAHASQRCEVPAHADVQARTNGAVLYTVSRPLSYGQYPSDFVGCVERTGARVEIESLVRNPDGSGLSLGEVALRGYQVAYVYHSVDSYGHDTVDVRALDLRHPHNRFDYGGATGYGRSSVPRLLLTGDGAVAYTIA